MSKKQTAVEWLFKEIYGDSGHIGAYTVDGKDANEALEQAKEMERKQIHAAFDSGVCHLFNPKGNPLRYFEETYKGGKDE